MSPVLDASAVLVSLEWKSEHCSQCKTQVPLLCVLAPEGGSSRPRPDVSF